MRSSGAAAVVAMLVLLLLPLLYVLSIGPVVWLHGRGMMSPAITNAAETIYEPLDWAAQRSALVEQPLSAYVEWWQPAQAAIPLPPPASAPPVVAPTMPSSSPAAPKEAAGDSALSTADLCG